MNLGKTGVIGRFRPLHIGSARMLESICESSDHLKIGIGSSNKYNVRNPFTPEETREMIDLYLKPNFDNYEIICVPDFAQIPKYRDGTQWEKNMLSLYGPLDVFVSGNPYVSGLLEEHYEIMHPSKIVPREKWIRVKGSMVRAAMAKGEDYGKYVPDVVKDYLESEKLVERFKKEFGLQTIFLLNQSDPSLKEEKDQEKNHTYER